ncbi:MAG: hypothetical protein ACRD3Q_18840, partial [Terriglobales bacterium]
MVVRQLVDLPAVIGSPSNRTFVQWTRFNFHGPIALLYSRPDKGVRTMKRKIMPIGMGIAVALALLTT